MTGKLNLPEEKIRKMYFEDLISLKRIAEEFSCSVTPIYRTVKESN